MHWSCLVWQLTSRRQVYRQPYSCQLFKYLGDTISRNDIIYSPESKLGAWKTLRQNFTVQRLFQGTQNFQYYYILSHFLYGCETWWFYCIHIKQLKQSHNDSLIYWQNSITQPDCLVQSQLHVHWGQDSERMDQMKWAI